MCFADCINDHANYILIFMIKLTQHVNNSSLYIDACAHGNSAYLVVIQPQSVQQQSMTYINTNRIYIRHALLLHYLWLNYDQVGTIAMRDQLLFFF